MPNPTVIRSAFFDLLEDPWDRIDDESQAARFVADGLLVVQNGEITDFGAIDDIGPRYSDIDWTDLRGHIVVPGFIDGHVHFPQVRVIGAYGHQLLDWLTNAIFPEEQKYTDPEYAAEAATHFFNALLASGTTTCQAFTTSSPVSTRAFFDEATRRGMRTIAGLTGIDRFAPEEYCITADEFYAASKSLIEAYHRKGRNLYAITPRFAVGCTPEMLDACARLRREHPDCWVNTHISETPKEVALVRELFPECKDYTAVQEKFGLLGPKFTAGHGVYLSDEEFRRFSKAGAAICFCPTSNLFLGSGLFRLGKALDRKAPVRVCLGTDVGAGNSFSLLRTMDEAYKVGMCQRTRLDGSIEGQPVDVDEADRNRLSPYRAFYLATLGGARALYLDALLGNFQVGKEADFVVLNPEGGQYALAWRQSQNGGLSNAKSVSEVADILFGIMACGDDRSVEETWVAGQRVFHRH